MTVVGLCKGMDMSEFEYDAKGAGGPCGLGKACQEFCPNRLNILWNSIFKKTNVQ